MEGWESVMPFASQAQQRFMHAVHPEIAARWDKETKWNKKLPKKVKKYKIAESTGVGNALMFKWITEVSAETAWAAITKAADLSGYTSKKIINKTLSPRSRKKNPIAYLRQADRIRRLANTRGMY